ncbi:hypothetical protein ACHAWF_010168, partial [Thalassiosira exigua]
PNSGNACGPATGRSQLLGTCPDARVRRAAPRGRAHRAAPRGHARRAAIWGRARRAAPRARAHLLVLPLRRVLAALPLGRTLVALPLGRALTSLCRCCGCVASPRGKHSRAPNPDQRFSSAGLQTRGPSTSSDARRPTSDNACGPATGRRKS